jgi:hypothetical protein
MKNGEFVVIAGLTVIGVLGLTACAGYSNGPISPSDSVLSGLEHFGYISPVFIATNPRHKFSHTDVHVDMKISGCKSPTDVAVETSTDTNNTIIWYPVVSDSHKAITPREFYDAHHCTDSPPLP